MPAIVFSKQEERLLNRFRKAELHRVRHALVGLVTGLANLALLACLAGIIEREFRTLSEAAASGRLSDNSSLGLVALLLPLVMVTAFGTGIGLGHAYLALRGWPERKLLLRIAEHLRADNDGRQDAQGVK